MCSVRSWKVFLRWNNGHAILIFVFNSLCPNGAIWCYKSTFQARCGVDFKYFGENLPEYNLAYLFSLVYFSIEVCVVGAFPHYVSTRRDPCVRVTLAPPSRKNKIEQWWPGSPLEPCEGGIWTDAWVCLHYWVIHYWVVIWVAGYFNSPLYCTVYGGRGS